MAKPASNQKFLIFSSLILILIYLIGVTPSAEYFLLDLDGGNQLAGAQQIVKYQEFPYADFYDSYGILRYSVSALSQILFGSHLGSEILTRIIGFAIGYFLLFILAAKYNNRFYIPLIVLFASLVLMPRHHKYFVVLIPYLTLAFIYLYSRIPSLFSLILLSLSVGVAGSYRHDYGLFCFLGASGAILLNYKKDLSERLRHVFILIFISTFTVILFLIMAFKNINIMSYVRDIIYVSFAKSKGLSLPHPIFHDHNLSLSLVFMIFHIIPFLFLILILRSYRRLNSKDFVFLGGLGILSITSLVQSGHRADYSHLLQGIPPIYLCVAITYGIRRLFFFDKVGRLVATAIILLFFSGLTTAIITFDDGFAVKPLGQVKRTFEYAIKSKQDYVKQILQEKPDFVPANIANELNRCTSENDRILVYPYDPQLYFFADRGFGGRLRILAPGEFSSNYYQRETIKSIKKDKVSLILWDESFAYDSKEERNSTITHSLIHEFIREHYHAAGKLDKFSVYALAPIKRDDPLSLCQKRRQIPSL
jgi:hypothetical protein